jgi:hypothetical protein
VNAETEQAGLEANVETEKAWLKADLEIVTAELCVPRMEVATLRGREGTAGSSLCG